MCKDIDVLPSALFNAKFVIRSRSVKENTVQWLSVSPEFWFGGLKARKESLHFRRRRVDMEKNGPSCLMLMGKRESWQLSKELSMQIHVSDAVARAANVVRWDESNPLPTGPPEKCLSTKKYHFIQKCLATRGSRVLSASLKTFACPWVIPVSNRCSYWWKAPRFLVGLSASDTKCNQNTM